MSVMGAGAHLGQRAVALKSAVILGTNPPIDEPPTTVEHTPLEMVIVGHM